MLSIMQRIHDNLEPGEWENVFENMSYLFNSDGKFCPNHIIKDENGDGLSELKLYNDEQEEGSHFVDFEELGISFKIPSHNGSVVGRITNAIQSGDMSCFDTKAIGLNILDAENQETSDISAKNFLDIADAVRESKKQEVLVPSVTK